MTPRPPENCSAAGQAPGQVLRLRSGFAAYATVASVILNLDEVITKQ